MGVIGFENRFMAFNDRNERGRLFPYNLPHSITDVIEHLQATRAAPVLQQPVVKGKTAV